MPTNKYITLTDSEGPLYGLSKRFKVISMKMPLMRTDSIRHAVDGSIDKANGAIIAMFRYLIRVPMEEADVNYGDLEDLKTLYLLNNPNGTPSDLITLTDHFGDTHECYFVGDFDADNLTTVIDGENAHFIVPITLQEKDRVA